MIQFVWEFVAKKNKIREFERYYSAVGAWAELFEKSPGFRGTILLRDVELPNRYLTIDTWDAPESYQAMRRNFSNEFEQLDQTCAAFTEAERRLGVFEVL